MTNAALSDTDLEVDALLRRYTDSKHGWSRLRRDLYDESPRWQWWSMVLLTKRLPPSGALPYPKIHFEDHLTTDSPPLRMIRDCLRPFHASGQAFDDFLTWLLYGFGDPATTALPSAKAPLFDHFADTFDLSLLLKSPGDWIGHVYETEIASKGTKNANGFFTTPPGIAKAMAEMGMHDAHLLATFNEPCCGTGRMLMAASNYCLHLSGQDINPTLVNVTKVNGWLYMPSLVLPCPQLGPVEGGPPAVSQLLLEKTPTTMAPNVIPDTLTPERNARWTATTLFPDS